MRLIAILVCFQALAFGQVPFERILNADKEPGNWLTYSWNWGTMMESVRKKLSTVWQIIFHKSGSAVVVKR